MSKSQTLGDLSVVSDADPAAVVVSDEPEDIDVHSWLARGEDEGGIGYVVVGSARLKIAALTEAELQQCQKASRRPLPGKPNHMGMDVSLFKLTICAHSLNKAAGLIGQQGMITPQALTVKLAGHTTAISDEVMRLSGFADTSAPQGGADSLFV